ncbi:bifunctional 2-polyprenyl-6-hydroxyphenol methylase/3-demethylubiquinol 3-O-methyltransferase UbiG [Parvularcula sp. ZS-1/3]|uniref:Ubiquinone biosynthesis O-methyltransferase n=1 Tax=Parvularcula mediterranea TaxID=2732508 RepID=A0A7Y3W6B2_9PROT|nr:bifunctional 2-polyprenyl-6-hydroxyphenol methylase/3-demethylubiquinol 3-O-methyltransferase UbiG [Parvularcula mediterranea]NNU17167.1 bifunctional 2-polyprenyl-6-hydroxyphenol methylase/3-demethylubiquinol 3-O-methyltransferase UbiG [Parvularcula mediterranea]
MSSTTTTIDPEEVEKFEKIAQEWWDPLGKFKPLHKFNPVRLGLIRDQLCEHFGRDRFAKKPLEGLRLLDIGCGGGLVSEPMARLGASVTGIDAAEGNVKTARVHAEQSKLDIDYRATSAEDLLASGEEPFDVVLNLEVVEHVADIGLFLGTSAKLLKPGGMMGMATLNRTLKAAATAVFAAEYVLRWLPIGTHDPRKFVKPSEAKRHLTDAGLKIVAERGLTYLPLLDSWRVGEDMSVNYMLFAEKPEA